MPAHRKALVLVTGTVMVLNFWSVAPAQARVLVEARLGNNVEGATLITNGPHAGELAVIDGWEVRAVPLTGKRTQPTTLFDTRDVRFPGFPSGMAYVTPEKSYFFVDQADNHTLAVTDSAGQLKDLRSITYLPDSPVGPPQCGSEGMVYLGDDSAFPDTIARTVFDGDCRPWIQIMDRQGAVQRDIQVTGLPADEVFPTGLAYLPSGRFLVGGTVGLWQVALDGTVIGGPTPAPGAADPEGLVATPAGRVYAVGYAEANVLSFDKNLAPVSGPRRSFQVGPGLSRTIAVGYDAVSGGWLMDGIDKVGTRFDVAVVAPGLDSMTVLFQPPGNASIEPPPLFHVAPGPGGGTVSCATGAPLVVETDRAGNEVGGLNLTTVPGLPPRRCQAVAYLPGLDAYALRMRAGALIGTVFVVARSGQLLQSFVTPISFITSLSVDPDAPGEVVAFGFSTGDTLARYDAATGVLLESSVPDAGNLHVAGAYAAGPGDTYAIYDANNSELAVIDP